MHKSTSFDNSFFLRNFLVFNKKVKGLANNFIHTIFTKHSKTTIFFILNRNTFSQNNKEPKIRTL